MGREGESGTSGERNRGGVDGTGCGRSVSIAKPPFELVVADSASVSGSSKSFLDVSAPSMYTGGGQSSGANVLCILSSAANSGSVIILHPNV